MTQTHDHQYLWQTWHLPLFLGNSPGGETVGKKCGVCELVEIREITQGPVPVWRDIRISAASSWLWVEEMTEGI